MVRYISTITVPFPPARVFALMSDWTNLQHWDINITKSVLSSSNPTSPPAKGVKYDCLFTANGMKDVKVSYECTSYDAPHKASFLGLATLFRSQDAITCEPTDNGNATLLTAEFNLHFRGILNPLSFLMNGAMQSTGPVVMADMEKFVHKQLATDSPSAN